MDDCVFCRIVKGELPSYKIYEDEYTYVFLDIAEDVNGHMVAIPKKHVNNILDCDDETLEKLITTVKRVSAHCVDQCGYQGVNFLNASDESAGQYIAHFHIHIIPRKKDDGIDAWPNFTGSTIENKVIYEQLKMM